MRGEQNLYIPFFISDIYLKLEGIGTYDYLHIRGHDKLMLEFSIHPNNTNQKISEKHMKSSVDDNIEVFLNW